MAENPYLKFVPPKGTTAAPPPVNPFEQFTQPGALDPNIPPPIPQRPKQTRSTLADMALSGVAGVGEGLHSIPGQVGDAYGFFGGLGKKLGDWMGLPQMTPEQEQAFKRPGGLPDISAPTTPDLEQFTGFDRIKPIPQTPEGEYVKTATSYGTQAATGGGRAIVGGLAAGLGAEAAGQSTKGTWAEPIARIIGGLGAGATGNTILNAYQRGRPRLPQDPSFDQLLTTADFGFEFARQQGTQYSGPAVNQAFTNLWDRLSRRGSRERTTPEAYAAIQELAAPTASGTFDISDLHSHRMALQETALSDNEREARVANQAIALIDNFIRRPDPANVISGDANLTAELWGDAMGNYAGAMRSRRLSRAEQQVDLSTAATHSGLNVDNKYRQKAAFIVNPEFPARRAGLSDAEVAMLTDVAMGTPGRNSLRYAAKVLGGGGGLGALLGSIGTAGVMSNIPGTAAAVGLGVLGAGRGLNALSNRATRNRFLAVDRATRLRTPLAAQMPPAALPPVSQMTIPEILAATTGPLREEEQGYPRLDRAGVAAVTNALIPPR